MFHPSALLLIGSATCFALNQILTLMDANIEPTAATTFYSSVFGAIAMMVVLQFVGKLPVSWGDFAMFCALGILGGLSHYCIVLALADAPANIIAPFQYFQLLGSTAVGYALFDHFPDADVHWGRNHRCDRTVSGLVTDSPPLSNPQGLLSCHYQHRGNDHAADQDRRHHHRRGS